MAEIFLYKYGKSIHLQRLLEGHIYINTLHALKQEEIHGSEIGDADEGILRTEMGGHVMDLSKPETLNPSMKRMIAEGRIVGPGQIIVGGQLIEQMVDCYMFCTSFVADNAIMKRMNIEYDMCVEIHNPTEFFARVTSSLQQKINIQQTLLGEVTYITRTAHHTKQTEIHPAFLKDPRYNYQKEFRTLWITRDSLFPAFELFCPGIKELVSVRVL